MYYDGTTPYVDPYSHHIGDTFTLNGDSYHIIANSPVEDDYVVALKDTLLTVSEITAPEGVTVRDNQGDGSIGGVRFGNVNSNSYSSSYIKSMVDSWATAKFTNNELKQINSYNARLVTYDELQNIAQYEWMYNSNSMYWTMTPFQNFLSRVWVVNRNGTLGHDDVYSTPHGAVRPVINVYKSAIPQS